MKCYRFTNLGGQYLSEPGHSTQKVRFYLIFLPKPSAKRAAVGDEEPPAKTEWLRRKI